MMCRREPVFEASDWREDVSQGGRDGGWEGFAACGWKT